MGNVRGDSVGVVVILGLKRVNKKIPGGLVAVIGTIAASWAFDLASHGVAVLGTVPSGLPSFGIPTDGWSEWKTLVPVAGAIFIVILAQSAATSRSYAARYNERFDENVDLVGLSGANIAAGLTGTFVVNGSPTKTQIVDGAGGRSQVASISTSRCRPDRLAVPDEAARIPAVRRAGDDCVHDRGRAR